MQFIQLPSRQLWSSQGITGNWIERSGRGGGGLEKKGLSDINKHRSPEASLQISSRSLNDSRQNIFCATAGEKVFTCIYTRPYTPEVSHISQLPMITAKLLYNNYKIYSQYSPCDIIIRGYKVTITRINSSINSQDYSFCSAYMCNDDMTQVRCLGNLLHPL